MYLSNFLYGASRKLFLCLLILCVFEAQSSPKPAAPEQIPGASTLSAEQVVELILSQPDLVVIDSRKKTEFIKGHIEGAINMLNTDMTMAGLEEAVPDKSTMILFYCNGDRCMRSSDAVQKALFWDYINVFWFRGGWSKWKSKRLPVITE